MNPRIQHLDKYVTARPVQPDFCVAAPPIAERIVRRPNGAIRSLLALAFMATAAHAQVDISQAPYAYANGVLAAPNYYSFVGTVPAGKELDVHRLDAYSVTLGAGSATKVADSFTIVNSQSAPSSAAYGDIHTIVNDDPGLANTDYRRVHCDYPSTGYCIARKTAARGNPSSPPWGMWLSSENVGPYLQAVRWVSADNPPAGTTYAIPRIDVIGSDVDVTAAVVQWNVSAKTTGDYLRILKPAPVLSGSGYAFRITKDGTIFIGDLSLDQYIDARIRAALGR
jgi:hypothetical protein